MRSSAQSSVHSYYYNDAAESIPIGRKPLKQPLRKKVSGDHFELFKAFFYTSEKKIL